jgi:hypothetical protein
MTKQSTTVKKTTKKQSPKSAPTTLDDFKSALLVVSLGVNTLVLIGWITIKVSDQYDIAAVTLLFLR